MRNTITRQDANERIARIACDNDDLHDALSVVVDALFNNDANATIDFNATLRAFMFACDDVNELQKIVDHVRTCRRV